MYILYSDTNLLLTSLQTKTYKIPVYKWLQKHRVDLGPFQGGLKY